ncbi:hemocytin [Vespula squamosa]|uniref:Hemocytin n=1 Tax=Vespula squamosa TaxID=30214 RepID=A0ABD1ZY52_VESSQ
MNLSDTIGILIEKHRAFGICKNLEPIEGITNCVGTCHSKTYFDKETWTQSSDCNCCQPKEYRDSMIELTCENGEKISKQVILPISCSCDSCASIK